MFALPHEAQDELRHPFTLRIFLDLRIRDGRFPVAVTRAALLEQWLNRRLDSEAVRSERITSSHFQQALRVIAARIGEANSGSVTVDELVDVPRFDPAHPPGVVVERLIGANILETLPGHLDRLRFTVEAVQDFYRAEADLEQIRSNPGPMAERFSQLSFTTAYPRLVRIGERLVGEGVRYVFASKLAELEPRMAAIMLRGDPHAFPASTRVTIADALGRQITNRHRVRAALAITLLGKLNCAEAATALAGQLLQPADPHEYLKAIGATAFIGLGHGAAAAFVYRWQRFGLFQGNETHYFSELIGLIRGATAEFQTALTEQAFIHLDSASETTDHAKAVSVLAYLGEARLVDHLAQRLSANGLLTHYENHALIALGTDAAGLLFVQSALAVAERLAPLSNNAANNSARWELLQTIHFPVFDVRYLVTRDFESHIHRLIDDPNREVSWIGSELAKFALIESLLYPVVVATADGRGWTGSELARPAGPHSCVTPALWMSWWNQSTAQTVRRGLLRLLPLYPTFEVEEALLDCLDTPELAGGAARGLGDYGAVRSAAQLRQALIEKSSAGDDWWKSEVAHALGDLRDATAVAVLVEVAGQHPDDWTVCQCLSSLGLIGTLEAESALKRLLQSQRPDRFEDAVCEALLCCGSPTAVAAVVERARGREDGPSWLLERLNRLTWTRGWRRGKYYTHIQIADLIEYLDANYQPGSAEQNWAAVNAFRQVDGADVRRLLRKWAERRGSAEDALASTDGQYRISDRCYFELADRGDESAIPYALDDRADDRDEIYVAITADRLRSFPSAGVAEQVRSRLAAATTIPEARRMLALLGRFGDSGDAGLASGFLNNADDLVANVACEATLRLSDPMLVPPGWREL